MKRKRKMRGFTPRMLFWTLQDQRRFIDAVEKFCQTVNRLELTGKGLDELLQFRQAKKQKRRKVVASVNGSQSENEVHA
jgi:hypothetical protein